MRKVSSRETYLKNLSSSTRINDTRQKEMLLTQINVKIKKELDPDCSYEDIVQLLGTPSKLGSYLSNPSNWFIDAGTPLKPLMDMRSFISAKGRKAILGIVTIALLISSVMILFSDYDRVTLGIIICYLGIWPLIISTFNSYISYSMGIHEIIKEKININYVPPGKLTGHVLALTFLAAMIFILLGFSQTIIGNGIAYITLIFSTTSIIAIFGLDLILLREISSLKRTEKEIGT